MVRFADRRAAGYALAEVLAPALAGLEPARDTVIVGLPRGGVPVAAAVAQRLGLPLDVLVVRKIGMPGRPELALGALGSAGACYLDEELIRRLGVSPQQVAVVVAAETAELSRREEVYRGGREPLGLAGATVVLIDDGLATGASMRAAAIAVRASGPAAVLAAAPVGPPGVGRRLVDVVDQVVVAHYPKPFLAVGHSYVDFAQVCDEEVRTLLGIAGDSEP